MQEIQTFLIFTNKTPRWYKKGMKKMSLARQIKLFSNFKRKSTKLLTTRQQIINISQEYERIGEQKNNDINHKLSNENIILKKFDINKYDTYISNTDYSLNKESSKY